MDQKKIDMFFYAYGNRFPAYRMMMIQSMLEKLDDQRFFMVQTQQYKDPILMLVISILVGHFGVDRILLGQIGLGIAKLLTCGGLGIWTLIDWFLIMNETREVNFQMLTNMVNGTWY
ncbi:MAG: TM2 domain-containing protein [Bacteroidota bacterium]